MVTFACARNDVRNEVVKWCNEKADEKNKRSMRVTTAREKARLLAEVEAYRAVADFWGSVILTDD